MMGQAVGQRNNDRKDGRGSRTEGQREQKRVREQDRGGERSSRDTGRARGKRQTG